MSLTADIRYVAKNFKSGLTDVIADLYDVGGNPLGSITLTEIDSRGVYHGSYTSANPDVVTAIVDTQTVAWSAEAVQKYVLDTYDDDDIINEINQVSVEVWEELLASHTTPGSFGQFIQDMAGSGFQTSTDSLEAIREAIDTLSISTQLGDVWDVEIASHTISGTFGDLIQDIDYEVGERTDVSASQGSLHAKVSELLDRLGVDADSANPDTIFEFLESIQGNPNVSLQDIDVDLRAILDTLGQTTSNIRYKVIAPGILERPETGSITHKFILNILDTEGGFADPDGSHVWIHIEDTIGNDMVASATMTRDAEGKYSYAYIIEPAHSLGQELLQFNFEEGGSARIVDHTTFVQDKAEQATVAEMIEDLNEIKGTGFSTTTDSLKILSDVLDLIRAGADGAASWSSASHSLKAIRDALDACCDSIDTNFTNITTEINEVSSEVWEELEASHNNAGTMGELIHTIDDNIIDVQGSGFATASHSLVAIIEAIDSHDVYVSTELGDIEGAGFVTASHSLVAIMNKLNDIDESIGGYVL